MRTNFNHLRNHKELFDIAVSAEEKIQVAKTQPDMKNVGNSMRQVGEGLLEELSRKYGFTAKSFWDNLDVARNMGILTRESATNFGILIRFGNICSHPGASISKQQLIKMYTALYEESYKMMNYYLTDEAVKTFKKQHKNLNPNQKNMGQKTPGQKPKRSKLGIFRRGKDTYISDELFTIIIFGAIAAIAIYMLCLFAIICI